MGSSREMLRKRTELKPETGDLKHERCSCSLAGVAPATLDLHQESDACSVLRKNALHSS